MYPRGPYKCVPLLLRTSGLYSDSGEDSGVSTRSFVGFHPTAARYREYVVLPVTMAFTTFAAFGFNGETIMISKASGQYLRFTPFSYNPVVYY